MSGFDDNPFGEPVVDNPFADPAVQQAARNTVNAQNTLEDYNPFEQENNSRIPQQQQQQNPATAATAAPAAATFNPVAVVQQNQQNIQQQNNRNVQTSDPRQVSRTQEELAAELERKAAELDRREQRLKANNISQLNNWPPLPEKCCFNPCFYQDINLEIPPEFQRIVRHLYYAWMLYTITVCANIVGGIILMFAHSDFETFGLALLYGFFFTPGSYVCWFRPAYKAFRSDSSFNFMVFFFVFFFQMVVCVIQAIGFQRSGYCGFITALTQFNGKPGGIIIGILLLIIAFAFSACAFINLMLLTKIHSIYRSSGASMAKAQAEFTSEFMRNQHVQQAAASAMTSAVNSQLNNRY